MAKYRKKPVIVEAFNWGILEDRPHWYYKAVQDGIIIIVEPLPIRNTHEVAYIKTLEGNMVVGREDWIIKGIIGELYPCRPDIFTETYEEVK